MTNNIDTGISMSNYSSIKRFMDPWDQTKRAKWAPLLSLDIYLMFLLLTHLHQVVGRVILYAKISVQ
jgi:hypothetical protein